MYTLLPIIATYIYHLSRCLVHVYVTNKVDYYNYVLYAYLPSHYITVTQIQYILIISIAWEFATN